MPIITTAECKVYLGIPSDTTLDGVLDVLIPAIQDDLETACGRKFDEATYTDQAYDGRGETSIWIPNTPVTSLTAVKLLDSSGTTTTLASTSYRLNSVTGELVRLNSLDDGWGEYRARRLSVWPDELQNVLLSYTGGYADGDMPTGLKLLMYELVSGALDSRGRDWKLSASSDGSESQTWLSAKEYQDLKAIMIRGWVTGLVV